MSETREVTGFRTVLDKDREVFVGKSGDDFYLRFENKGEVNRLRLSREAMAALISMSIDVFTKAE